ncbi:MAG: hypothetical protein GC171_16925 [Terrimonas sp.]|nr:hypothetical protein [Terrimonas sp.]
MKAIFIFISCLPFLVNAQDCNLKDVKDPLNQDIRLSTGFKKMGGGNDRFMVSAEVDKRELDFFFVLEGSNLCFDDYARVQAIFEGGKQKAIYRSGGSANCQGYFHIIFKNQANQPTNLKNLVSKKIISLKFTTKDRSEKVVNLVPDDQENLMKMLSCIYNASAELLNDTWKPKQ